MTSQEPLQIKVIVGRNIARARAERQWTQRVLANKLGMDSRAVSRWETGSVMPSSNTLVALALHFQRDPGWFYTDHETAEAA